MSSVISAHPTKGLEGVVATTSGICYIDGEQGVLAYRGYDIHELADHSTFEEVCYLLWFGRLPKADELRQLKVRLAEERHLDAGIISALRQVPKDVPPMDVLRTMISMLSFYDPESIKNDHDANVNKAIRLTSQMAMLVADYDRIRKGKSVVEADRSLSHAANFLLMLNGEAPSPTAERALDIALILHADHELNASTFAFGHHVGDGRPEGSTAWWGERVGIQDSDGDRRGRRRSGRAYKGNAGAKEESAGVRASRVSHGGSTGHPFTEDVPRFGRVERKSEVVRLF
jgi:citrate synthase